MPRRCASSQAESAASWYGRSSMVDHASVLDRGAGGDVLEFHPGLSEPAAERSVPAGGCAMRAHARVPEDARRFAKVQFLGRLGQKDRSSVESKVHDHMEVDAFGY